MLAASHTHNRAFSLIELVIVIVIIGIIAAIAVPRYASSLDNYRASLAARKVAADVAMAQAVARAASRSVTVTFDPALDHYTIEGGQSQRVNLSDAPFSSSVQADFGAGGSALVFDGYGRNNNPGILRLRSGQAQRTVTVDPVTGACTIQ